MAHNQAPAYDTPAYDTPAGTRPPKGVIAASSWPAAQPQRGPLTNQKRPK